MSSLLGAILDRSASGYALTRGVPTSGHTLRSPPPDDRVIEVIKMKRELRRSRQQNKFNKFASVSHRVDASPPAYYARLTFRKLPEWVRKRRNLDAENIDMLLAIKRTHFTRGRVDSRWRKEPTYSPRLYFNRVNNIKKIAIENKIIYKRLCDQGAKVDTTEALMQDWAKNRNEILEKAINKFVLFPPVPKPDIEDPVFLKPRGVRRPRVFFTLSFEGGATLGELQAELFTDVCPQTCKLFLELLAGDGVGFSYVGTHFFRKVPGLLWVGGDVARNNGFGCYAQSGRHTPIGPENFHFSHSMPGLLSMKVTCDDEVCGIFNITFKPLQQLDLRNVVFGRIIRPSQLFSGITQIGKALSTQPAIVLSASRQKVNNQWLHGTANMRITPLRYRNRKI